MTAPLPHGTPVSGRTARRLAADVSAGRITVPEATTAALERIALSESRVRALIHVDATGALAASRRTGRDLLLGSQPGRLAGVPVVVKDNIAVRDLPLTCGSAARKTSVADADATLVRRLRAAGAVVVAKSNLDEFGMGATTESSAFGPSRNPHDLTRTPGGSSGGSAASVAAGQVPLAVGTDTGGSIREPASQCGLVGVKPSYGSIPRDGIVPFAPSLDQAGPLARDVLDAALLHDAMAATTGLAWAALRGQRDPCLVGMRIGVVTQMSGSANASGVRFRFDRMVSTLCSLGCRGGRGQCARRGGGAGHLLPDLVVRERAGPAAARRQR